MKSDKAFFPISLGNHYYTNDILINIRNDIAVDYGNSIVVICDHLRYLSYKIRGIETEVIEKKIEKEVDEFNKRLSNCGYGNSGIDIENMSSFLSENKFLDIQRRILTLINNQEQIFKYINELSMFILDKNKSEVDVKNIDTQLQYFISETALSLYVTEILRFHDEFYKQFDRGLVVILYEKYTNDLKRILDKTILNRKFYSLKEIIKWKLNLRIYTILSTSMQS